jgi:hypothetical protein
MGGLSASGSLREKQSTMLMAKINISTVSTHEYFGLSQYFVVDQSPSGTK